MPSCAPRPVPTMSAVGVARPSAHGQAMISTATEAVKASLAFPVTASQPTAVASAITSITGTNTPEIRSTSRWIGAFPACASATSRAICASVVSAPTFVARTTSRPYVLIVAPTTSAPRSTSTGIGLAGQHRLVDRRIPFDDHSVGRDLLARPNDELVADLEISVRILHAPSSSRARIAAPELSAGARLEIAAEQDQRGGHAGDLEVDVGVEPGEQDDQRPAPGGQRAEGDQRVHRGGEMPRVHHRGAMETATRPEHDRRRERERDPLPAAELERRHHRRARGAERSARSETSKRFRSGRTRSALALGVRRKRSGVTGGLDRTHEVRRARTWPGSYATSRAPSRS